MGWGGSHHWSVYIEGYSSKCPVPGNLRYPRILIMHYRYHEELANKGCMTIPALASK